MTPEDIKRRRCTVKHLRLLELQLFILAPFTPSLVSFMLPSILGELYLITPPRRLLLVYLELQNVVGLWFELSMKCSIFSLYGAVS